MPIYAFGKKIGSTNLIAVSSEDKRRITMEIMVSTDEQTPNASQRQLHPTSTIEISVLGNRVAATGRARTLEDATGAADVAQTYSPQGQPPINETTLEGSQQVNIRVRFVEVSSDLSKEENNAPSPHACPRRLPAGRLRQIPSVPSSEFVTVPVPITDRHGITRMHAVTWPEACLTPDPTAEPILGQNLPPGCANAYNLMRMTEHQEDLVRGRKLGAAPAGPAVRAAQRYIYGSEGPLGAGVPSSGGVTATLPDATKELSGGGGAGGGTRPPPVEAAVASGQ
jgi:hypothetical protein